MTQTGTVTAIPAPGTAVVRVVRQSACSHDCAQCAGCGAAASDLSVRAASDLDLSPGDRVELYSDNRVLGIAALVYLGPVVLFLAGYLLPATLPEGLRYVCGGLGFLLGLLGAVACDRRVRRSGNIRYQVTRKL